MASQIPTRDTSKYARQYAGAMDPARIAQIFHESCKIAISSKNPVTARDRFELAVEAYHQVMSMKLSPDLRAEVQRAMERLAEIFPSQVVANEALGLRERARKLKTPKKRLELLRRAGAVVDGGLTEDPYNSVLRAVAAEIRVEILESEATTK